MLETWEPKQIKIKLCFKYEVLIDKKRECNDAKTACEAQKGILASVHQERSGLLLKVGESLIVNRFNTISECLFLF